MIGSPPNPLLRRASCLLCAVLLGGLGCGPTSTTVEPGRAAGGSPELPPAYPRDQVLDPGLVEVAKGFTAWAEGQKSGDLPAFGRVEILPPTPTILPYGIGTYQKEMRLPIILITGPGWSTLSPEGREELAALSFRELSGRLAADPRSKAYLPTLTIQTPQGLELAWINLLEPGRKILHGED